MRGGYEKMNIHITNLHNMGGTATLAQDGVAQVAKELGYKEMPIERRSFYDDYWNMISHHLDGTIASLYFDDIVIFQYPSWNGPDYDRKFVDKVRMYHGTKLIIFVQDLQKLLFNSDEHILMTEIATLNMADLLILPTKKMYQYMLQHGLRKDMPILFQKIWEAPGFPQYTEHMNLKRFCFTGNYERFPFLKDYYGVTPIEQFDGQKPEREDDAHFQWKGFLQHDKMLRELSRGGYGLVWSDREYFDNYYSLNQPHKLGFNLAAGIPVIIRAGCENADFVKQHDLGYAVESLEEADILVQQTSDETYMKMINNIKKIQVMLLKGMYTKKVLLDSVIQVMEQ